MQTANDAGGASPATPGGSFSSPPTFQPTPNLAGAAPAGLGPPPGPRPSPGPPPPLPVGAAEVSALLAELQHQRLIAAEEKKERDEERREDQARAAAIAAAQAQSIALLTARHLETAAELAALKKSKAEPAEEELVPYVPHYEKLNPHPQRPKFQDSDKPQLYEPANQDKTFKLVCEGDRIGAAGWEYKHRLAECSYLKDIILHGERCYPRICERLQDPSKVFFRSDGETVITVEEDVINLISCQNSTEGVYDNLVNKRCGLLQLKALIHDKFKTPADAEKRNSLIQILEDDVYGLLGGLLPDNIDATFQKCLQTYGKKTEEARLKAAAQASAKATSAPAPAPSPASARRKVTAANLPVAE